MAGFEMLRYEVDGPVATLTINRPEKRNAVLHVVAELVDAFAHIEADPGVLVTIFTGAGDKAFSAGADLATSAPTAPARPVPPGRGHTAQGRTCSTPWPTTPSRSSPPSTASRWASAA
ncbi:MAG: enoyl-CoA hydratase-related protein [Acidimicrobiales bacterium]